MTQTLEHFVTIKDCMMTVWKQHHVRPVNRDWSIEHDGTRWLPVDYCACPLGAVLICRQPTMTPLDNDGLDSATRAFAEHIAAVLGVTIDWVNGFTFAFDGDYKDHRSQTDHPRTASFKDGAQHGFAIADWPWYQDHRRPDVF